MTKPNKPYDTTKRLEVVAKWHVLTHGTVEPTPSHK